MESIITAATVLTMYFNAVNSNDANYMYNGEMEDGVVNKIEVYAQNDKKQMEQKMALLERGYTAMGKEQSS